MESNLTTPAIVVFTSTDCADVWNDVLLGTGKKKIPFIIQGSNSANIIHNAWLAAYRSLLLVGIGCSHEELVVYYRNLPTSAPLFTLTY